MIRILLFGILFVMMQTGLVFATDTVKKPAGPELAEIIADFDRYAEKAMMDWKIPGMAIGIVNEKGTIFAKGYGSKTLGRNDPVTQDTIFQIGSASKAFTACLMAMLVDEGKIKWDDRVIDHDPDFMMHDPWVTREFQVLDLLSQRSGMPAYAADALYMFGFGKTHIKRALRNIKPVTSFRSQYAYQNALWTTAGDIIEKYTGKKWEESLVSRIFQPLGMMASSADRISFQNSRDVSSLHARKDGEIISLPRDWEFLDFSYATGPAGAINSNITDMAKWLTLQINKGKINGKPLVSEKNMKIMQSPKVIASSSGDIHKNAFYCLGWIYLEHEPFPVLLHTGVTLMKTMIAFVPEQRIGIIILSNYVTGLPELLALRFIDQYAGKQVKDTSSDILIDLEKAERYVTASRPVKPKNPSLPMPFKKYTGDYTNAVYGSMDIRIEDEKLIAVIGPSRVKIQLVPWDKHTFSLEMISPIYNSGIEQGLAVFHVDSAGNTTGVTLDILNQGSDLGMFNKVIRSVPG